MPFEDACVQCRKVLVVRQKACKDARYAPSECTGAFNVVTQVCGQGGWFIADVQARVSASCVGGSTKFLGEAGGAEGFILTVAQHGARRGERRKKEQGLTCKVEGAGEGQSSKARIFGQQHRHKKGGTKDDTDAQHLQSNRQPPACHTTRCL